MAKWTCARQGGVADPGSPPPFVADRKEKVLRSLTKEGVGWSPRLGFSLFYCFLFSDWPSGHLVRQPSPLQPANQGEPE